MTKRYKKKHVVLRGRRLYIARVRTRQITEALSELNAEVRWDQILQKPKLFPPAEGRTC